MKFRPRHLNQKGRKMAREQIKLGLEKLPSGKIRYKKMYRGLQWKSVAYDQDSRRNQSEAWGEFVEWRQAQNPSAPPEKPGPFEVLEDHERLIGNPTDHFQAFKSLPAEVQEEILSNLANHHQNHEVQKAIIQDRERTVKAIRGKGKASLSCGKLADGYLAQLQIKASGGQISTGQYGVKRNAINQWVDWFGKDRGLDTLTENDITEFYLHLVQRIANGENPITLASYHGKVKQFLETMSEEFDIPKPKNLRSKRYVIKAEGHTVINFTIGEAKTLLALASDRVKLWLLLMLNCGMTQKDLSDLKANEVDWLNGRIVRPRSKEPNAPTINYLLWDETFELLKEIGHREGNVFTKADGGKLVESGIKADGKEWRTDAVVASYRHLLDKIKRPIRGKAAFPKSWHKSLKVFRKTSASLIETSPYAEFVDVFLDHTRVARKHYLVGQIVPKFDESVIWLGEQLDLTTRSH